MRPRWGIGSYEYTDENGIEHFGYGFPFEGLNPENYWPDMEICTAEEIKIWEEALDKNKK